MGKMRIFLCINIGILPVAISANLHIRILPQTNNNGRCAPMRILLGLSRFYSFTFGYIHLNQSLGVTYIMFTG